MLQGGLWLKITALLVLVRKIFEKLINNKLVDYLHKIGFSSSFHYGFRSSCSTADRWRVASCRIAINKSSFSPPVALDFNPRHNSRAFNRVWHLDFLHKILSYGVGQIFDLFKDRSIIFYKGEH